MKKRPPAPDQSNKIHKLPTPSEEATHKAICTYMRSQYPHAIWFSDGSGIRLSIGMAVKQSYLRCKRSLPDFWVMLPKGGYHALIVEIKREGITLKKKNGEWKEEHFKEQQEMIDRLNELNYHASFKFGFDQIKAHIDWYMAL